MVNQIYCCLIFIFIFTIPFVTSFALPDVDSSLASEALNIASSNVLNTNSAALELENIFSVFNQIPESVLNSGDKAASEWLEKNSNSSAGPFAALGSFEASTMAFSFGGVELLPCIFAITKALAEGAIPALKVLRIKKIISSLGGIRTAVKLLIKTCRRQTEGVPELVKELLDLVFGIGDIMSKCF
jgi:hypothetical protein